VIFRETAIDGALLIVPEPHVDERGSFARVWCAKEAGAHGLDTVFVQSSLSSNKRKGTVRGMHYSVPPHAEAKVVRCVRGEIYDVLLDVRPRSRTFGVWFGQRLSADNCLGLSVPPGVAHGFQTMEDASDVLYQMSDFYDPASARGLRWDDPSFDIRWPEAIVVISDRDRSYADFEPRRVGS
jgi:dTDP-4-dehydrorhamnose 3,5-epimerase